MDFIESRATEKCSKAVRRKKPKDFRCNRRPSLAVAAEASLRL